MTLKVCGKTRKPVWPEHSNKAETGECELRPEQEPSWENADLNRRNTAKAGGEEEALGTCFSYRYLCSELGM